MSRKRKPGTRTKSGRLSRAYKRDQRDHGTPEAQAKRLALVGTGDPVLAATAIGVLHAHGFVDREQFDEALDFRWLYCAMYGLPWPRAVLLDDAVAGRPLGDAAAARIKQRFERKLQRLTVLQRRVVTDVCVLDRKPTWFFVAVLAGAGIEVREVAPDRAERAALLAALDSMLGAIDIHHQSAVGG